jgi:hypothetical protein
MLESIYLSKECCEKLGVLYETPYQEGIAPVIADPVQLLVMREWDEDHLSVFRTFLFLKRSIHLIPEWRDNKYHNGWFKITNLPNTRFFVTTDINIEVLLKQRNLLVKMMDDKGDEEVRLLTGVVALLEHMLEDAYKDDKRIH